MAKTKPSYVYVVSHHHDDTGFIGPSKIGVTADPARRLIGLQSGNPFVLRIYLAFPTLSAREALAIEAAVLAKLDRFRTVGEWFALPPEDIVKVLVRETGRLRDEAWVAADKARNAAREVRS